MQPLNIPFSNCFIKRKDNLCVRPDVNQSHRFSARIAQQQKSYSTLLIYYNNTLENMQIIINIMAMADDLLCDLYMYFYTV